MAYNNKMRFSDLRPGRLFRHRRSPALRQCRVHGPRSGRLELPKIDWLSTFRLRAGYTVYFLFYATAGLAVGDFRLRELTSGASQSNGAARLDGGRWHRIRL